MDKAKVLGGASETSKAGKLRLEIHEQAGTARDKAEIESLYAAYEQAVEERCQAESMMMNAVSVFAGKDGKVIGNDIHAVKAMRDVALAAIELARIVSGRTATEDSNV